MPAKGHTQYQPLVDYLAARDETEIILTFAQIEQIIGRPLSDTAYTNGNTWTWPRLGYVQQWRALGWRAKLVRFRANPYVVFTHAIEE